MAYTRHRYKVPQAMMLITLRLEALDTDVE